MDEYEIKLDIAVQKTLVVKSNSEDEALEEVFKRLEAKGIDKNRVLELKLRHIEKKINADSPSKMTN